MLSELLTGRPGPPRNFRLKAPRELVAICRKALSPMPNDRYAHAGLLAADVAAFQARERVSAYRYGPIDLVARFISRHPIVMAVVASAAVFGVVLLLLIQLGAKRFVDYVRQTEARSGLQRLSHLVWERHLHFGRLPPPVGPTPRDRACDHPGGRYPLRPQLWRCNAAAAGTDDCRTWRALGFAMRRPHRFRYRIERLDAKRFVIRAEGDPECSGHRREFRVTGTVDAVGPVVEVSP